jgi:predicted RNase H-like HicB family nuclease
MPQEITFLVHQDPEGYFIASGIGHSIVTDGQTMEELRAMVRDAVECHFMDEIIPQTIHLEIVTSQETFSIVSQ